jgi:hypothetical protein
MVSTQELSSRIKDFFKFSRQELVGLLAAIIVTAFIFSFRDWGDEQFSVTIGFTSILITAIVALMSFLFRLSCQKVYGLSQGYRAEFKVWWVGLAIMIVFAFVTKGYVPIVIVGGMFTSFMVKQRLGEFRYGFSYSQEAVICFWGVLGNLIMAIFFAVGVLALPGNYFFEQGLMLNLMMGLCTLFPLSQLDGLKLFFGNRSLYYLAIGTVLFAAVLLLSKTKIGVIIAVVIGTIAAIIYTLIGSEK